MDDHFVFCEGRQGNLKSLYRYQVYVGFIVQ